MKSTSTDPALYTFWITQEISRGGPWNRMYTAWPGVSRGSSGILYLYTGFAGVEMGMDRICRWDDQPHFTPGQAVRLFLDDERNPPSDEWVLVRHSWQAKYLLEDQTRYGYRIVALSLDHDLGAGESGYDVATWLEEQTVMHRMPVPHEMLCHSANSIGRVRIEQAFDSIRRHTGQG